MTSDGTLPPRSVPLTRTYLKMAAPPKRAAPPPPAIPHAILHAEKPSVHFYRYLYNTVGERWTWTDRRYMSDDDLAAAIHDEAVEVMVLYLRGVPAGFAELDFRSMPEAADLAYFGLMPDCIGMKLGPWFLHWAISELWAKGPDVVTINTCTLDHPAALPLYQRAGFVPYSREEDAVRPLPA